MEVFVTLAVLNARIFNNFLMESLEQIICTGIAHPFPDSMLLPRVLTILKGLKYFFVINIILYQISMYFH